MSQDQNCKKALQLELKLLLEHLKYTHLDAKKTLPIIIKADLPKSQEDALLAILRENIEVIGWIMADIKRISQTINHSSI